MRKEASILLTLLLAALIGAAPAHAQSFDIDAAIERVNARIDQYCDYAVEMEGTCNTGNWVAGMFYDRHLCSLLARFLGFDEHMQRLETLEDPPLDGVTTGYDAAVFAASLSEWVIAAERLKDSAQRSRVAIWNLDCVGTHGIPSSDAIQGITTNADFEVRGKTLYVYGDIDSGFFPRLREFADQHQDLEHVALGGAGGSVADAINAGLYIRSRGLNTSINGNCFSACPLVFSGGVRRTLWVGPSRLGFHMASRDGKSLQPSHAIYSEIGDYLEDMGVDPEPVLLWMWSASPQEMHIPEPRDLCGTGITTWIQRLC